jgi:tripartite-type tricarboxylate transporter receptor subunit TctC
LEHDAPNVREDAMRATVFRIAALACFLLPLADANADEYPNRIIKAVTSQGPGGLSDIFMRALADQLGPALGQTIVVENHSGASGTIGARVCADAPPDGYTFCILPAEPILINPIIFPSSFDPKARLVPITRLYNLTQVFAVNADLHVKSFDDLIALTKAKPKTMSYMAPSLAKVAFMEELNKKYGTDFVRVPFKGGGDAVNSMLSGTTPIAMFGIGNLKSLIATGKIVGLAVDGDERSPLAPSIPTFKETGHPIAGTSFFGLYAPTGTPKPIIDRLYREVHKIASNPEFQKRHLIAQGLAPVLSTPEAFAKQLEEEREASRAIVKTSGLYPNVK